ncbi:Glycerate kinase [Streptococcus pluranimalium]
MKETVEISVEEYINLRNTINSLQSENRYLKTVFDSIKVVMQNSGIVK